MKLSKFDALYKSIITQAEAENIDKDSKPLDLDKIDFDNFDWNPTITKDSWQAVENAENVVMSILTNEQYAKKYANKIPLNKWKQINNSPRFRRLFADPSQVSENILAIIKDYLWDYNKKLDSQTLTWKYISQFRKGMSPEFLLQVKDKIRWDKLFDAHSDKERENLKSLYPIDFIYEIADNFKHSYAWYQIFKIYKDEISADFVEKYINSKSLNTNGLTKVIKQYMENPDFYVKGNKDKFNGFDIDFIRKYQDNLDWKEINNFDLKQIPEQFKKEIQKMINAHLERAEAANKKFQDAWANYMDGVAADINARRAAGLQKYDGLD